MSQSSKALRWRRVGRTAHELVRGERKLIVITLVDGGWAWSGMGRSTKHRPDLDIKNAKTEAEAHARAVTDAADRAEQRAKESARRQAALRRAAREPRP